MSEGAAFGAAFCGRAGAGFCGAGEGFWHMCSMRAAGVWREHA